MVIRNWIMYIMAVAGLLLFCILYIKPSGAAVLGMAAVVPVLFSLITFFPAKRGVKIKFENQMVMSAAKFAKIEIPFVVENRSALNQGSRAVIYITVNSGLGTKVVTMKKKIFLVNRREEILLDFVPEYSGMSRICIEKVRIYNGFSLLRPTIRVNASASFFVLPEYREYPIEPHIMYEEKEGESEMFSSKKPGNDPSELYDIRYYRPGDKLNRINWKFSAKKNTLMVQDYGFPIACDTAVFIDIAGENDQDKIEQIFEMLYYLAMKFTMTKKPFYVVWKDFREGNVKRRLVSDGDQIFDLFVDIFSSDMGKFPDPLEELYDVQYEGEFLSSCIFIYTGRKEMEDETVRAKVRADYLEFVSCV